MWFSSPDSRDVLRAKFSSSGSRGQGHQMSRHSVFSAELSRHVPFHGWMQQLLRRQPHFENKQTNNPLPPLSCLKKKKAARWCVRLRHTRIAFRVLKGLSLEPDTSKESPSLCRLYHAVSWGWRCAYVWLKTYALFLQGLALSRGGTLIPDVTAASCISDLSDHSRRFLRGSLACSNLLSLGKGCLWLRCKANTMLVLPCFSEALLFVFLPVKRKAEEPWNYKALSYTYLILR